MSATTRGAAATPGSTAPTGRPTPRSAARTRLGTPRRTRDSRRFRRAAAAVVMVVPATAIAISRPLIDPFLTDDTGATVQAIADRPEQARLLLWMGVLIFLTIVPAFLAAGRLAMRRHPVLATVATGVNLAAYLGTGIAFNAADNLQVVAAGQPLADREAVVALLDANFASGVFGLSIALFVVGHIIGAVLLGFALRGAIPAWAWVAMAVSQPLHFVCFVILQDMVLDAAAWGLTALAFLVCAITVLRTPDDEWDLPPLPAPTPRNA